jgi:hypothetical protein
VACSGTARSLAADLRVELMATPHVPVDVDYDRTIVGVELVPEPHVAAIRGVLAGRLERDPPQRRTVTVRFEVVVWPASSVAFTVIAARTSWPTSPCYDSHKRPCAKRYAMSSVEGAERAPAPFGT